MFSNPFFILLAGATAICSNPPVNPVTLFCGDVLGIAAGAQMASTTVCA